jgi:hypothetical protein
MSPAPTIATLIPLSHFLAAGEVQVIAYCPRGVLKSGLQFVQVNSSS